MYVLHNQMLSMTSNPRFTDPNPNSSLESYTNPTIRKASHLIVTHNHETTALFQPEARPRNRDQSFTSPDVRAGVRDGCGPSVQEQRAHVFLGLTFFIIH